MAGLDGIMSLRELVEKTSVGEDSMENMENGSIREKLIGLSESLDRHPVLDIDVDVLRAVTNEILVSFELKGRRRIRMFSSLRFIWICITEFWTVPII